MTDPTIRCQDVSKCFEFDTDEPRSILESIISVFRRSDSGLSRKLWAVQNVSFDLMPGECLGLVGRNGSGKSTLLKLTAGIIRPTSGRVEVRGRLSALLELGAGFHPDLTGQENVWLNGSILGLSKADIEKRFDSIVEFSELGEFIHMPVKHYSSGMYMRLGFSVAVHVEPDVLLVDEILAVGDQSFQEKCIHRLHKLKAEGKAIAYVSHSLETMRALCSRVIWIEDGVLRASGPTDDLIDQYLESHSPAHSGDDPGLFQRWGSGEIEIVEVRLLNTGGQDQDLFRIGEGITVELHYRAHKPIEEPSFGLIFYRDDGISISNPDNQLAGLQVGTVNGSGVVRCRIDRLPFMPALYRLTVGVYDSAGLHAYDIHDRAYEFRIASDTNRKKSLIDLQTSWEVENSGSPMMATKAMRDKI